MNPRNELEDWLTELPPLDGDEDDEPGAKDLVTDDLETDDGAVASLDDAAADDLEVDDGVDITDESSVSEDDDRWEADVGEAELDLCDEGDDEDSPEAPSQDDAELDVADELPATDDDAGEEGTTDPIEHSLDEELPALDADEEGDFEDTLLREVQLSTVLGAAPRWADVLWETTAGSPWPLEALLSENDALVTACALPTATAPVIAVVTAHGIVSARRGGTVRDSASAATPPLQAGAPVWVALTGARPALWVANRTGELARSDDLGATWTRCAPLNRAVLALTAREDGSLAALARDAKGVELMTTGDGSRWFTERVSLDLVSAPMARVWIAQRGHTLAIGDADGVSIARGGSTFVRVQRSAGATAGVFAGAGGDAPLVLAGALVEGDDALYLGLVRRDDPMEIIAEIERSAQADEMLDEATVLSLAWDDARGLLYVVTPDRVSSWSPRRRGSV